MRKRDNLTEICHLFCILFSVFPVFITRSSYSQWDVTYGGNSHDSANSIQQTHDGGYVVAGWTNSFGAGDYDFLVLGLTSNGDVQWQKTYGGGSSDYTNSIQQTDDDGYIVAGETRSFGAGSEDFWVLKLNADGDVLWQNTYGGSYSDNAPSVQQTRDGGYILAGYTRSFGAGNADFWVLKLASNGDIQWQKTYGKSSDDVVNSIRQTSDGGYIMAGFTNSFGAAGYNFWVLKLYANGDIEWQNTYGGGLWDYANSIQPTSDGYIVAGYAGSFGNGGFDIWVLKLSSNGDIQWQKTYGGGASDWADSIQQTDDGGYIVAGETRSFGAGNEDFWVLKLNQFGSTDPFCNFAGDTNVSGVGSSNITVVEPNISINNSNVTPQNTAAEIYVTNLLVDFPCYVTTSTTTTTTTTTIRTTRTTSTTTTTTLPPKICRTCISFRLKEGKTKCKTFLVWNCGKGTLNWTVSEGCNWLTLSPSNGTSTRSKDKVTACIDTTGMAKDDYECTVTITVDGASNSPQTCVIKVMVR
ncbi:MAG TPA: BACON domain-containing protein [Candidatus Brocadiia bacterium]|nr:hypothetical protein [Planctomycetota bacterium]MDO8093886.1 hypothetical protein [Candidatus Brocadiales bacterium]